MIDLSKPRSAPWDDLVTSVKPGTKVAEAIDQAGLDYEVGFSDLRLVENGTLATDKRATYRKDNGAYLATVGSKYQIVQNRDAFAFLTNIVDSGDMEVLGAGCWHNGARPWLQCRLPNDIVIAGDTYIPFIFVANTFDGSAPVTVALSGIRVVCQNTYAANLKSPRRFVVRHLGSASYRIEEARKTLGISFKYFEEYRVNMERLAEQPITDEAFRAVVDQYFVLPDPNKSTEEQREAIARKRAQLFAVYKDSPSVPRGTKYGGLQAFTEYYDHIKNGQRGNPQARAERKSEDILMGDGVANKDRFVQALTGSK